MIKIASGGSGFPTAPQKVLQKSTVWAIMNAYENLQFDWTEKVYGALFFRKSYNPNPAYTGQQARAYVAFQPQAVSFHLLPFSRYFPNLSFSQNLKIDRRAAFSWRLNYFLSNIFFCEVHPVFMRSSFSFCKSRLELSNDRDKMHSKSCFQ